MDLTCVYKTSDTGLYYAQVSDAEIISKGTVIRSIKGKHQLGKHYGDVRSVVFFITQVHYFPIGLTKIYPSLRAVSIHRCGLKEISAVELNGLQFLTMLAAPYNELTSLPSNLLRSMTQLEGLNLTGNKLQFLSPKMFSHEHSKLLRSVDLTDNKSIDLRFPADCSTLEKLKAAIEKTCDTPIEDIARFNNDILAQKFCNLWTSGCFSDFIIEAGPKEFKVHKNVLGTQSPVMAQIFEDHAENNKSNRMKIDDFSPGAVEEFLKYFYCGDISEVNAMEIFSLASQYEVAELKKMTETVVEELVDKENATKVLKLGSLHGSDVLKQKAFDEIRNVFKDVILPDEMMKQPLQLSEMVAARKDYEKEIEMSGKKYERAVDLIKFE